jgi:phosphoribosylformylglycinamidine synthase subunit PurS
VTGRAAAEERPGEVTKIIVEVMLKREIHDPQGEAISRACQRLGYGEVVGVRQGKRFEVELRAPADSDALTRVETLAGELLANPVIEEFVLHEE